MTILPLSSLVNLSYPSSVIRTVSECLTPPHFLSIRPGSIVITIPGAKGISLFGASEGNSCAEQPHPWPILPGRIFSKPASEYTLAAAKYSSLKRIPGFRIEKNSFSSMQHRIIRMIFKFACSTDNDCTFVFGMIPISFCPCHRQC